MPTYAIIINTPGDLKEPKSKGANDTIISPSGFQKLPKAKAKRSVKLEMFKVQPSELLLFVTDVVSG